MGLPGSCTAPLALGGGSFQGGCPECVGESGPGGASTPSPLGRSHSFLSLLGSHFLGGIISSEGRSPPPKCEGFCVLCKPTSHPRQGKMKSTYLGCVCVCLTQSSAPHTGSCHPDGEAMRELSPLVSGVEAVSSLCPPCGPTGTWHGTAGLRAHSHDLLELPFC